MNTLVIVDGDGGITFKEFNGIKMKDYFRECKALTRGKHFTVEMIETMTEEIRDVVCPCCLDETGYFEVLVGIAYKKGMVVLNEDGVYTVCVGCLMKLC